MRRIFVAAVVVVIALAFLTALLIPTPAGYSFCPWQKGKGKLPVCHGSEECPPCMEWDGCKCECRTIPGCKPDPGEPIEMTTKS